MGCLKCGKETEDSQVFCDACRQSMDSYPVKPGTPVHLTYREPPVQEKKPPRRRVTTTDETIAQLKGIIRWLTATVAILTVLICLLAGILIHALEGGDTANVIGRNYTTADTAQPAG